MKKNNFKHFQSVARCESYNASFLPAARGKRACNLELVSCRFRQRCYAVPARSGWAASSFRIMGVWRFEALGARWRAIWHFEASGSGSLWFLTYSFPDLVMLDVDLVFIYSVNGDSVIKFLFTISIIGTSSSRLNTATWRSTLHQ